MAEPEATSSHVVIDITEAGGVGVGCCAVCMEPAEWVAVGWCGHREVCVVCAARLRFFQNDSRCCICRAHCPSVVVINPDRASVSKRGYCGYHRGMSAYFHDRGQYEAIKKMCVVVPSSSAGVNDVNGAPAASANDISAANNGGAPPPESANLDVNLSGPSQSARIPNADNPGRPQNNNRCLWVVWLSSTSHVAGTGDADLPGRRRRLTTP